MNNEDRKHSKSKRTLLKLTLVASAITAILTFINLASLVEFINKIRNRLQKPTTIPDDNQRAEIQLTGEGAEVSVELALNSRCSSDYDNNTDLFHWGLFDKNKKLTNRQLAVIEDYLHNPLFSEGLHEIQRSNTTFLFSLENQPRGIEKDRLMVLSGMQQQALCLISSALSIGCKFSSMGKNGKPLSDHSQGLIRIKVDAMKPSYAGSSWTTVAPSGLRRWLPGNLPNPTRNGDTPLINTLQTLKFRKSGTSIATNQAISQLLWAARGRTPHKYKSKEWGMTVPTAHGHQDVTSVFYCSDEKIYEYVNWEKNRPTHHLSKIGMTDKSLSSFFTNYSPEYNCFIIFSRNRVYDRALWEVGYGLINLLLQASAWNLHYNSVLLDDKQIKYFNKSNIENPVALVAIAGPRKS